MLTTEAIEHLRPMPRHERAHRLLTGELGPLYTCPLDPAPAAVAYLVYLAWIRARVRRGMLSGRPGFEAWGTMESRVNGAARRAAGLGDFGPDLFARLGLRWTGLTHEDAVWWRNAVLSHGAQWRSARRDLPAALTAARLLDELLRQIDPKHEEDTTDAP